jgi:hypothetical protein
MTSAVVVRCIRNSDATKDDITIIRPRLGRDDYLMRYTDGLVPRSAWVTEKTRDEVMEHLHRMFEFLSIDKDPFSSIQVSIPNMPVIFIGHNALNADVIHSILRSVFDYLNNPGRLFSN